MLCFNDESHLSCFQGCSFNYDDDDDKLCCLDGLTLLFRIFSLISEASITPETFAVLLFLIFSLISEALITPETFAEVLCDDLDLPAASFVSPIAQAIRQQSKQFDIEPEIVLNEQKDQRIIIKVFIFLVNIIQLYAGKSNLQAISLSSHPQNH